MRSGNRTDRRATSAMAKRSRSVSNWPPVSHREIVGCDTASSFANSACVRPRATRVTRTMSMAHIYAYAYPRQGVSGVRDCRAYSPVHDARMNKAFGAFLRNYRTLSKLTQGELAERLGVSQATISRWEKGQQEPDRQQIDRLVKVIPEIQGEFEFYGGWNRQTPFAPVSVTSAAEAGVWLQNPYWPDSDQYVVTVPANNLRREGIFGVEVRGPSANLLFPPGSILICQNLKNYDRALKPGAKVIVHTVNSAGLTEVTVKQFDRDPEHPDIRWLWPRSTHPEFQSPVRIADIGPEESLQPDGPGDLVFLRAIVLWSIRVEALPD